MCSITLTEYTNANQINRRRVDAGSWTNFTYNNNGSLTSDGANSYTWDRANRLLSMGGSSYAYDGAGNRIRQTVGVNVTQYLLDVQPGLAVVLAETTGANTNRYVHGPMGIHAQEDNSGSWTWPLQDGLGSVRGVVDDSLAVQGTRHFAPYGTDFGEQGSFDTPYGFTGEQTDGNALISLRTRYLNPMLGLFTSSDSFEGLIEQPLSLNSYSYVQGDPVNRIDPSGMLFWYFQSNLPRSQIYNPAMYITSPILRGYAHAWIERWMEFYGGMWQTHLEFPGARRGIGERRVDAILFDRQATGTQSPIDFSNMAQNSVRGSVYEIEPITPVIKVIQGIAEVNDRLTSLQSGSPFPSLSIRLAGTLRTQDSWNPRRPMGSYGGAPYNLRPVQWSLGSSLLLGVSARGVFEVDPKQLEVQAAGILESYFIFLPTDGLIVYETKSRIASALALATAAITVEVAGRYLADRYDGIRGVPRRRPGYAWMETPRSTPNVPEFNLSEQFNNTICIPDLTTLPEMFPEVFASREGSNLSLPLESFEGDDVGMMPLETILSEGL